MQFALPLADLAIGLKKHGRVERLLVAEVVVEQALVGGGALGDPVDARAIEAKLAEFGRGPRPGCPALSAPGCAAAAAASTVARALSCSRSRLAALRPGRYRPSRAHAMPWLRSLRHRTASRPLDE